MTDWLPWYYAPGYLAGAVLIGTALVRQWRFALTAALLVWVWGSCALYWAITGGEVVWYVKAAIDLSAAAMLVRFGGRTEAIVAASLGFQVVCLAVYGGYLSVGLADAHVEWVRWWAAFDIACAQAIFVAGASIYGGGRRIYDTGDTDIAYSGLFGLEGGLEQALSERKAEELIRGAGK